MTFNPEVDAMLRRIDEAQGRQRDKVPTRPHHHYAGQDAPHVVMEGVPSAGSTCTSSSASCHMALDAGLIVPCPTCERERDE